jgi:choline dehydrogenase-like flavoprotein
MPMAAAPRRNGTLDLVAAVNVFPGLAGIDAATTLLSDTLCTALECDRGTVTRVHLKNLLTGEMSEVTGSCVVIAADAVRTPQLLFASGIRPAALGRWLNEHAMLRLQFSRQQRLPWSGEAAWWVPSDRGREKLSGQITAFQESDDSPTEYQLNWFSGTSLDADNRIEFDGSDLLGMPKARFYYALSSEDEQWIYAARRDIRHAAEALSAPGDREVELVPRGLSLHYTGTVRLGRVDDGTSVASSDGRVWRTRNVFVAGNGAIPTAMTCNVTLTAAALAVGTARSVIKAIHDGT